MTVRSSQLGKGGNLGAGPTTLYTVPAGKRAIVKGIWIRNHGTAQTGDVQIATSGGPTLDFFVPLAATPAAGSTVFVALWIVLVAGDVLKWASGSSQTTDILVAGAELDV